MAVLNRSRTTTSMLKKIHRYYLLPVAALLFAAPLHASCDEVHGLANAIQIGSGRRLVALPFSVEVPNGSTKRLFASSTWGIKIKKVECDGAAIRPSDIEIYLDEESRSTLEPTPGLFTYLVYPDGKIYFVSTLGTVDTDYKIETFEIGDKFNTLVITYQVRYSDSTLGPISSLSVARKPYQYYAKP
jgi:hypothetical protein